MYTSISVPSCLQYFMEIKIFFNQKFENSKVSGRNMIAFLKLCTFQMELQNVGRKGVLK